MHDLYWAVGDGGPQEDTLGRGNDDTNILGSIVRISVSSDSDVVDLAPSGNRNGGKLPRTQDEIYEIHLQFNKSPWIGWEY